MDIRGTIDIMNIRGADEKEGLLLVHESLSSRRKRI